MNRWSDIIADGSIVAIITGMAGAMARWFSEVMNGSRTFTWFHLPMLIIIGAFLGYMGSELSNAMDMRKWSSLFAGASGAMGAYGFEFYARVVERVTGTPQAPAHERDEAPGRPKDRSDAP